MKDSRDNRLLQYKIFRILEDFLQPDSEKSLEFFLQSILALVPESASGSTEVNDVDEVFLGLAEQISYQRPSKFKLARLVEQISRSAKLTDRPNLWVGSHCFGKSVR